MRMLELRVGLAVFVVVGLHRSPLAGDAAGPAIRRQAGAAAGSDAVPPERLADREAFRDARFCLFIHWGVYSLLGQGEWVMQNRNLPVPTYEWLASTFDPAKFDAAEWVAIAKAAGARYITITARHHDGFSMFASDASPYNIVSYAAFGRDPLAALADERRRQGLKLFFYYPQLEWHHPDYYPRGQTGRRTGRPESGDWNRYLDFMDRQIEELLTRYGPVGSVWLDGMWDRPDAPWRLARTYAMIHRLQPSVLMVPNHHQAPWGASVTRATMLGTGETVGMAETRGALVLTLPPVDASEPDRVVVLKT